MTACSFFMSLSIFRHLNMIMTSYLIPWQFQQVNIKIKLELHCIGSLPIAFTSMFCKVNAVHDLIVLPYSQKFGFEKKCESNISSSNKTIILEDSYILTEKQIYVYIYKYTCIRNIAFNNTRQQTQQQSCSLCIACLFSQFTLTPYPCMKMVNLTLT